MCWGVGEMWKRVWGGVRKVECVGGGVGKCWGRCEEVWENMLGMGKVR